jgi:O-glycosyl hydrolase
MKNFKNYLVLGLILQFLLYSCEKVPQKMIQKKENGSKTDVSTKAVQTGGSITVNIGSPQQTVDMIGAGTYFYSGHLVNGITNYSTASNWLWQDLNVNVFRIVLWANGVEDLNDNNDPNNTNFSQFNFTSNTNLVTQITAAKKAISIDPNIKIWALVLSPPKYLKTNGSVTNGGTLNSLYANAYNEFGEFIYAHLKHLKDNNVNVSYLSFMNEPDYPSSAVNYDAAEFTPTQAGNVY